MRFTRHIVASLAIALLVAVACAPKTAPATPAAAPAPAAQPSTPPATPAPAQAAAVAPAPATVAATPAPAGAAPAAAAGGRGARAGGTPPPPPVPPPAVMPAPSTPIVSDVAPTPDPRVGLRAGPWDAAQAAWNLRLLSTTPPGPKVLGITHSDLAFTGKYVIQGNYNGFEVYDIANPVKPILVTSYLCPASQNDVSVFKHLLFMSSESTGSRADCGFGGIPDPVSKDRVRGIRIFDIADVAHPKLIKSVETCRGSHTHTVVEDPHDKENVYIYVSGSSGVRPAEELPGCLSGPIDNPNAANFRLEVIKVPVAHPELAAITSSPRIFQNLAPAPRNAERDAASGPPRAGGAGAALDPTAASAPAAGGAATAVADAAAGGGRGGRAAGPPTGPDQCHDITVYPAIGLAGGACRGYGLLLDIREAAYPVRIDIASDANMSMWHSATFNNDGTKILFSDEWGGGSAPRCRDTDKMEWGADALFTLENNKMVFKSYYKMPAAQTSTENCVAHNGSLIPIPGRDVMVQGWYQGGISVFDWTDLSHPKEIAYFDRGPMDAARLISAGSWSVYWYNGVLVSSEIARGLDIFELLPSGLITQNELEAAKTVRYDYLNTQGQPRMVWPPSFALARAYVDQLERSKGLAGPRLAAVRVELGSAEKLSGAARKTALTQLAASLTADATSSSDASKVKATAGAVTDLAAAQR